MKKLPLGTQNFKILIENNYLYIDKTQYIHQMIETGRIYFLSRPRRFGKSLLLSTIEEIYKGNKKLFKGLYIYDKWDWDNKNPVIKIDFGAGKYKTPEDLENSIEEQLYRIGRENEVEIYSKTLSGKFSDIIIEISKKKNRKVVILIDEYDKAILDNISNEKLAENIRDSLNDFFSTMKANDEYIEFIFITGVTKFSKTSIFSGLNNITDLTVNSNYSKICGYTQKDLEAKFKEHIKNLGVNYDLNYEETLKKIKEWYDGYSWNGNDFVYNPYSILSLFNEYEFDNYWFETGTPSFLMKLIKNYNTGIENLFNNKIKLFGSFPTFKIDAIDLKTIFLQTGYLTIKEKILKADKVREYTLAIPNKEVYESLYVNILSEYTYKPVDTIIPLANNILKQILTIDQEALEKSLEILLNTIPYDLDGKIKKNEAYYHVILLSLLRLIGFDIQGEVLTLKGRVDAVLRLNDTVVIIEFKYSEEKKLDKLLDEAFKQIHETGYYKPYMDKNLIILGIAIQEKDIKCRIEELNNKS